MRLPALDWHGIERLTIGVLLLATVLTGMTTARDVLDEASPVLKLSSAQEPWPAQHLHRHLPSQAPFAPGGARS